MLQDELFREAKLLLQLEEGKASIPTLQALLIMHQHEGSTARDRIGRTYRCLAIDMYQQLDLARYTNKPTHCSIDEWRGMTTLIWGTFVTDT
jgi:hypothetical protein